MGVGVSIIIGVELKEVRVSKIKRVGDHLGGEIIESGSESNRSRIKG